MKLHIHKNVLRGFRRRAWAAYPSEHLEVIVGNGHNVHMLTPIKLTAATPMFCAYDQPDMQALKEDLEKSGLEVLGTIHTHPDCGTAEPSQFDWESLRAAPEQITGVAGLYKKNKRRYCNIKFYQGHAPFELEVT